jgi:hypothetical protein
MTPLMLALLTGCSGADGVWLFTLHVDPQAAEECISSLSHNFVDASQPAGDDTLDEDPWSSETLTEISGQAFFGLITSTADGAVLVVAGETYTGLQGEGGGWTFDWTQSELVDDTDQHASGYGWTAYTVVEETTAFDLTLAAGSATGELISDGSVDATYNESDAWGEEVAATIGSTGRIPASSYLVKDDGAGGTYPATNDLNLADCSSNPCTLGVTTACSLAVSLDAELTDLDPAAFGGIDGAGQDAGL